MRLAEETLETVVVRNNLLQQVSFYLPSLAAIWDGNGGQQKREQRSRMESEFIVRTSEVKKKHW